MMAKMGRSIHCLKMAVVYKSEDELKEGATRNLGIALRSHSRRKGNREICEKLQNDTTVWLVCKLS